MAVECKPASSQGPRPTGRAAPTTGWSLMTPTAKARKAAPAEDDRRSGPWSQEEDKLLEEAVRDHGAQNWSTVAAKIPGRTGKSCRLRWCNQLSPEINKESFSEWEDAVLTQAHLHFGTKWATIAKLLHKRTDNAVKNHWNCSLKRRLAVLKQSNRFLRVNTPLEVLLQMGDCASPGRAANKSAAIAAYGPGVHGAQAQNMILHHPPGTMGVGPAQVSAVLKGALAPQHPVMLHDALAVAHSYPKSIDTHAQRFHPSLGICQTVDSISRQDSNASSYITSGSLRLHNADSDLSCWSHSSAQSSPSPAEESSSYIQNHQFQVVPELQGMSHFASSDAWAHTYPSSVVYATSDLDSVSGLLPDWI